jgi:hypothetical protein
MKNQCYNHPEKNALNFCHSCNRYFCSDCLSEGIQYYYCKDEKCQKALEEEKGTEVKRKEIKIHTLSSKERFKIGWFFSWRIAFFIMLFALSMYFIFTDVLKINLPLFKKSGAHFIFRILFILIFTSIVHWTCKVTLRKYFQNDFQTPRSVLLILNFLGFIFMIGLSNDINNIYVKNSQLNYFMIFLIFVLWVYMNGYAIERVGSLYHNIVH